MIKKMIFFIVAITAVVAVVILSYGMRYFDVEEIVVPSKLIMGNNKVLHLIIADTEEKRALGLSGRATLTENEAMLFVFKKPGIYGFWMKDMLFPIDMLWLDHEFKIVSMQTRATPQSFPTVYQPTVVAQYVLETYSGFVEKHKLKVGWKLNVK